MFDPNESAQASPSPSPPSPDLSGGEGHSIASVPNFQFAVEHQVEGVALLDAQGLYRYVNPAHARLFGYTPNEMLGRSWKILYSPVWQRALEQQFPSLLASGVWHGEVVAQRRDGSAFDQAVALCVIRDAQGQAAGFVCTCRDISDQTQAQKAARDQDRQFRTLFDLAPIGIAKLDLQGRFQRVNPWLLQLLGYTEAEALASTVQALTHPDDLRDNLAFIQELLSGARSSFTMDQRYRRKGGDYVWANLSLALVRNQDGTPLNFIATVQRIEERKQAEDLLRETNSALSHAMPGIARFDPGGRYLYVNAAYAQTLGYAPEALLGQSWEITVHPDDRSILAAAYERMKREGKVEVEARGLRADGSTFHKLVLMVQGKETGSSPLGHHCFMRDITERKQAEESLRSATQFLQGLVQTLPLPVVRLDLHGNITGWNQAAEATFGWNEAEVLGKQIPYIPPEKETEAETLWNKATQGVDLKGIEIQRMRRDGTRIDLQLWSRTFRDQQGNPTSSLGILSNITERKHVEQALRESYERLERALEASHAGTWRVDLRTGMDTRDASLNRLLGYDPKPSTQHVDEWFSHVHPEDLAPMREAWDRAQGTGLYDVEHRLVRRDGKVLWVHDRGRIVQDDSGGPLYAIGAVHDITARKQLQEESERSQRFINSIIENIPHMIFVKDAADLRFARLNLAGEELLGFSREELIGKTDSDFFPREEANAFTAKDREVLNSGRLFEIQEEPIHTRLKGPRVLHTKKIPIFDEKGRPQYLLGISEDITERKQIEQRLRQSEKMEAIGTLAGGIAHDFNNILAAMIGYTELARDGIAPGSRAQQNLDQVLIAGQRAKSLIQQILAFSRNREPQREAVDLRRLLDESFALLRASIPATIAMDINLMAPGGLVQADPTQLQQVILNLCTNAAQAMRSTGGSLSIRLDEWDVPASFAAANPPLSVGPHIRLTVRDTGVGMSAEVLRRIFDPFFTTKKVGEGTGLGLSAALGIVTSHGGTLTVHSEPGKGSTFCVYLPKLAASDHPATPGAGSLVGGSERILFVDDEVALVRLAEQMLGHLGYRVTALTDPVLALGQIRSDPNAFDLIMTDHTMPGMSGESFAQEVLRLRPSLPILLCTGFSQGLTDASVKRLGIRGLIEKPLTITEMANAIRAALRPAPATQDKETHSHS